jgi:cation transport protein ChaC
MSTWIFGYGSLLFRPGFEFLRRAVAAVDDFERRLDQGSPDHRGTPEHLGRVATLVHADGARCWGAVFEVADGDAARVLLELDAREQGGYERRAVRAALRDEPRARIDAVTWVATAENTYHLGAAPLDAMVRQIRAAHGPSGANSEYVLRLAATLRALDIHDAHVFAVERALLDALARAL